ncbi:MAG: tail fiber protein, partial [Bacilli bacterium]|nr:tail fiber protein [Bacilli bacterium]
EIINYMGTIVPDHYLECDGKAYKISDYPILAEHIKTNFGSYNYFGGDGTTTFAVPDLRGEFLRGSGTNSHSDQGNGANVGTHQDATGVNHIFTGSDAQTYMRMTNYSSGINFDSHLSANENGKYVNMQSSNFGTYPNGDTTLYTSRPTNTSVMYAIRYE